MKQSKVMSFVESLINILIGFGISLGAQMVFLPMLGVTIHFGQNFAFAVIMTVISIARSFILRRVFEALHIRRPFSPFMQAVIAERYRQIDQEGWSFAHDDQQDQGLLADAGACYAQCAGVNAVENAGPPSSWPWHREWWKPAGFRRDLVKASALIVAEGDRFDRLKSANKSRWPRT